MARKDNIHPGNVYGIYAITLDGVPGKVYIGMSCSLKQRFKQHINNIVQGGRYRCAERVAHEYKEKNLTPDCIKFHILNDLLTYEEARAKEAEYILKYRSYEPEYGWNSTTESNHLVNVHIDTIAPPLPKEC